MFRMALPPHRGGGARRAERVLLQPIAVDIPQKLGEDYKQKYLCSVKSITVALLQSCFSLATDCQKQHDSARKRITEVKSEERKIYFTHFTICF